MVEIYYKRLIDKYGLWLSPEVTANIIREAHSFWCYRAKPKNNNIALYWKDVATVIGISTKVMSQIVTGKKFPAADVMDKLIEYFDLRG